MAERARGLPHAKRAVRRSAPRAARRRVRRPRQRIAAYVGGVDQARNDAVLARLAQTLVRPDPNDSPVRWAEYRRWWSGRVSPPCSPRIPRSPCRPRSLTPSPRQPAGGPARGAVASAAADHAGGGVRPGGGGDRQWAGRDRPVQRGVDRGRPHRLAGSLDRAHAAAGHTVQLGRLRHRRPHRYRLVGHAAAAAGDEAAATCRGCTARSRRCRRLAARVAEARDAVDGADPGLPGAPDPPKVATFAHALIGGRDTALTSPEPLLPLFDAAIAAAEPTTN